MRPGATVWPGVDPTGSRRRSIGSCQNHQKPQKFGPCGAKRSGFREEVELQQGRRRPPPGPYTRPEASQKPSRRVIVSSSPGERPWATALPFLKNSAESAVAGHRRGRFEVPNHRQGSSGATRRKHSRGAQTGAHQGANRNVEMGADPGVGPGADDGARSLV